MGVTGNVGYELTETLKWRRSSCVRYKLFFFDLQFSQKKYYLTKRDRIPRDVI